MALNILARRTAGKLMPFLIRRLPPPPSSPSRLPSHYSTTPKVYIPAPIPFSQPPLVETSDWEDDLILDGSIISASDPDLLGFVELVSRVRGEEFPSKGEALAFLRSSNIQPSKDFVLSAIWELRKDWESGLLALQWGEECVSDCPSAWHLMIWELGTQGRFDVAWDVLRRMHRRKMVVRHALVIMMERYIAANQAAKAIRTFRAMEKFNIYADSAALYALLRALCKHKNVEEAEEMLFLDRKLFPLETEGFNIILNGWCNIVGDLLEAKRIWREMSTCCIYPDGISYSHMISCSSKAGNLYDSLRLYDEMKRRGCVPDLEIYNSLIYAFTRENCLKDARAFFNKIKEAGLEADINTYNSIIQPLCELQKLDEARVIMKEIVENGLEPNLVTYNALAMAESMEGTLELLEKMKNVGCDPTGQTFLLIYNKFFRLNQSENALRVWIQMRRYNVTPDSSHYSCLVQGLVTGGQVPKSWQLHKEMISKGFTADPKLEKLLKDWRLSKGHESRAKQANVQWRNSNRLFGEKIFH